MLHRLHERRTRHLERNRAYRVGFAVVGFLVVIAGIVLSLPLVPGPGLLLVAIGLGMLALEFVWAERLLTAAVDRLERLSNRIWRSGAPPEDPERRDDAPDDRRREAV